MLYFIIIILLIAIILILLQYIISQRRSLEELTNYSHNIANDNYQPHILKKENKSLQDLFTNLNLIAEKLQNQKLASMEENELLDGLFENMAEGILVTKENGDIICANEVIRRKIIPGIKSEKLNIRALLINKQFIDFIQGDNNNLELDLPDKGKSFLITRFQLPKSHRIIYLFNDITDARNLKRIKADFITNLSHELRTPLTAIKGYLETIRDKNTKGEEKEKFFNIVCDNVDRLINIVSDLLVLSDIERTERKLYIEEFNLNKLAEEVVALFIQTAKEKGLYLKFSPVNIPLYTGDKFLIQQLLVNLISNGIRFTEKGGVELEIKYNDKIFIISVSDTGIGIPGDEIPKIFERFYTVDKARSRMHGGTGLGLSIVKHIVQLHRGEINVESKLGVGSKFTVILPQ